MPDVLSCQGEHEKVWGNISTHTGRIIPVGAILFVGWLKDQQRSFY
ncbi:Uncharacterized protein YR821_0111 [Yersinia ruckeri]|nr:hypothetical protein yruck0001_23430 [Yersinia ruckeri ATCC 29473]QTD75044.1 Uncharacterized protein YR821_0111 [Yersinia ruckeri]